MIEMNWVVSVWLKRYQLPQRGNLLSFPKKAYRSIRKAFLTPWERRIRIKWKMKGKGRKYSCIHGAWHFYTKLVWMNDSPELGTQLASMWNGVEILPMVFWKSHGFPCSCSELSYQVVSSSYFLTGKYLVFSEDQGAARKFSVAWGMLSYLKPNCYIYCKCAIKQTQLNTKSCSDLGILIVGSRNHKKAKKKKKNTKYPFFLLASLVPNKLYYENNNSDGSYHAVLCSQPLHKLEASR